MKLYLLLFCKEIITVCNLPVGLCEVRNPSLLRVTLESLHLLCQPYFLLIVGYALVCNLQFQRNLNFMDKVTFW